MKTLLILITAILLLFTSCSEPIPPSAALKAAELRSIRTEVIELTEGMLFTMSPDGKWYIVIKNRHFSLHDSETKEELCTTADIEDMGPIDLSSFSWSPDGRYLAFTLDFFKMMQESDLWVVDTKTGQFLNLTDDGISHRDFSPFKITKDDKVFIDVIPFWAQDSKTVYFCRYFPPWDNSDWSGFLYSVSIDGGEAEEHFIIPMVSSLGVWGAMLNSKDHYFYTHNGIGRDRSGDGIWRVNKEGEELEQIYKTHPEWGSPVFAGSNRGGDIGLFVFLNALTAYQAPSNTCFYYTMDMKTGNTRPIKTVSSDDTREFSQLNNAALSPDGSKVVYTYYDKEKSKHILAITDVNGEGETVIHEADDSLTATRGFVSGGNDHSLIWTTTDRIFVRLIDGAVIFDIGKK